MYVLGHLVLLVQGYTFVVHPEAVRQFAIKHKWLQAWGFFRAASEEPPDVYLARLLTAGMLQLFAGVLGLALSIGILR